jgi:predicted acyl esterase
MFGGSYGAMMATRTAALQPPHLVALAFESEYANFFGDCFFIGGWRSNAIWAARHMDNIPKTMLKGPIYDDPKTGGKKVDLDLWKYQVANNNWKNHPKGFWENTEYNAFWMQKDFRSKYDKLKTPMLMIESYFDDGRMHDGGYINYQVLKEK